MSNTLRQDPAQVLASLQLIRSEEADALPDPVEPTAAADSDTNRFTLYKKVDLLRKSTFFISTNAPSKNKSQKLDTPVVRPYLLVWIIL